MAYVVKFEHAPLWVGRTQHASYSLHRAIITAQGESWELAGYVLWSVSGTHAEPVEAYAEVALEPGNGLYGDQIASAETTDKPLPEPDRKDIVEFAEKFSELCEERGDPLLESELLV